MQRGICGAGRFAIVWVAWATIGAGCAEDQALNARVAAIKARQGTVENAPPRLELSLTSGTTRWCPSSLVPNQVRVTRWLQNVAARTPVNFDAQGPRDQPGDLPFDDVQLMVQGATLTSDWVLTPPAQVLDLLSSAPVALAARLTNQPEVATTLALTTTFDCDQVGTFAGRPGRPGVNAGHGEDGEPGLTIAVDVGYLRGPGGQQLVLVKVVPSAGVPAYFLLTRGRRLGLDLGGGSGGMGGPAPRGYSVRFGVGGGLGGNGGDGGRALVRFDARFPELQAVVSVINGGGMGGPGGAGNGGDMGPGGRPGRAGAPAQYQSADAATIFADEISRRVPIMTLGRGEGHI